MHHLQPPSILERRRQPALATHRPWPRMGGLLVGTVAIAPQPGFGSEGLGTGVIQHPALGAHHPDQPGTRGDQDLRPLGRTGPEQQCRHDRRESRNACWSAPEEQPQPTQRNQR